MAVLFRYLLVLGVLWAGVGYVAWNNASVFRPASATKMAGEFDDIFARSK
ncbi:MAG: hypothetical protein AAB919_02250 [Patescibacteria group bacterium]